MSSPHRDPFAKLKLTPIKTPEFHSEEEEANWWDSHPDQVEDFIERAERSGAVTHGTVAEAFKTENKAPV